MDNQAIALVDMDNCYASCERLFRPDLRKTPIITLSNNDGCVVARSKEAKLLGVKMGAPVHQIKHLIRHHGIQVFSSNYTLYGDISRRVMETLEELAPRVDVYSIDEAFLDLTGIDRVVAFEQFGAQVKETVYRHTGMPVCVGIAPTKTLAKLANRGAKKYPATGGVVNLMAQARQRKLMSLVAVEDVWGVGAKISAKLNAGGIHTALQLADADPATIRRQFSVVLERTARELNGIPCLEWEDAPTPKKQIMCSRSFGSPLADLRDLEEAVAHFVAQACEKLRKGEQRAQTLMVFVRTSPFRQGTPQHSGSATRRLVSPSSDTREFIRHALELLADIYRPGFDYAKAGVMLSETTDEHLEQGDLFAPQPSEQQERSARIMAVMDTLNQNARGLISTARHAGPAAYAMRRDHLSPAYTTNWTQLPVVN